jgi:hypothetical protein
VRIRVVPEPDAIELAAVEAATRNLVRAADGGHPAYRSAWRRAGTSPTDDAYEASARPRSRRGAARA